MLKIDYKLRDYQTNTVNEMKTIESKGIGGILHLEMGLGKTLISLHYINKNKGKTLILCSKTLLMNWKNEIHKFFNKQDYVYNYIVLHKDVVGSLANRITINEVLKYNVVIMSYSTLTTLYTYGSGPKVIFDVVWDRVFADESHTFANRKTTLFIQMIILKKIYGWCLSGTPIRNKYCDLTNQIYFIKQVYNKTDNKIEHHHIDDVNKLIITKMRRSVGIILPEIKHIRNTMTFSARRQSLHDQLCVKLDATNCRLVKYVIGRFYCSCPYIVRNRLNTIETKNRWYIKQGYNSPRFIEVVKIINKLIKQKTENGTEKIIIFSMFTTVLKALMVKIKRANPILICGETSKCDREANLNKFKTTKSFILLMTYKVGSEGLNITEANHVILLDIWFCPATHEQAIARVYRPGQKRKVTVYSFLYKNSVESYTLAICKAKKLMIKGIFKDTEFYGY